MAPKHHCAACRDLLSGPEATRPNWCAKRVLSGYRNEWTHRSSCERCGRHKSSLSTPSDKSDRRPVTVVWVTPAPDLDSAQLAPVDDGDRQYPAEAMLGPAGQGCARSLRIAFR